MMMLCYISQKTNIYMYSKNDLINGINIPIISKDMCHRDRLTKILNSIDTALFGILSVSNCESVNLCE